MTKPTPSCARKPAAFTLIELLVVLGIITVLAALIFPTVRNIRNKAALKKVRAELSQIELAIDSYKAKYGFYPPDNPGSTVLHQLYFELTGTTFDGTKYQTPNGEIQFILNPVNQLQTAFGAGVSGFVNCTRGANTDDAIEAVNFLRMLKPSQYVQGANNGVPIRILCSSVQWPRNLGPLIPTFVPVEPDINPNPIQYDSSRPTNNANAYDLWVDVFIGGKTNRVSNWSEKPQFVH